MKYSISLTEYLHIAVSVVTIALAFTLFPVDSFSPERFVLILFTVGSAFVLHELAHKFVAIKYGAKAEYKVWTLGLVFVLFLAFITNGAIIFAAPGAVYIYGSGLSKEKYGKIALAGPLMNLALAMFFLFLLFSGFSREFALAGVRWNVVLGAFNLIPFGPFDGKKVYDWNTGIWGAFMLVFGLALVLTQF